MRLHLQLFLIAGVLAVLGAHNVEAATRQIALTLDDAPRDDTAYFTGAKRKDILLATLKDANVRQVAFFCNSERMDAAGTARIEAYAEAGHLIANHSHSHADLHRVGVESFVTEIAKADEALRGFKNFRPWFRYPYLHEGKTIEVRDAIRSELKKRNLLSAYVTVDVYDWHMDRMFQDAIKAGKKISEDRLRSAYVDLLADSVEFYDDVAVKQLGRSPRHVLLLHENDLAALYLGDLVARLRATGWEIISPDEAFRDPIASVDPDTLRLGQGRVIAMAVAKGYQGQTRRWEDEQELQQEFERRRVWE
ncbi:MAG: polysaccharide deacetylase family protein [Steroidobacter sp.]